MLVSPPFNLLDTLSDIDDAIDCNADIADAILELGLQAFNLPVDPPTDSPAYWHGHAKPSDMAKAHSTIRQFYRDWSAEGFAVETKPLLEIILGALQSTLPKPSTSHSPAILLPGAGLGRLLFELSLSGYNVEGNEISWHQLLASNFVLNAIDAPERYRLYPFVSTFTNHLSRQNQLKEIRIPDIHPGSAVEAKLNGASQGTAAVGSMNMAAGDFLTSYPGPSNHQTFDAVVTVYFIDTAPNLFRYIETIKHCLCENGIWINVGPLLWHFDDRRVGVSNGEGTSGDKGHQQHKSMEDAGIGEPGSFELTEEEVLALVRLTGFEIVKHGNLSEDLGGYIQDPHSMIQNRYRCSYWTAQKLGLQDQNSSAQQEKNI